jgi:hypothetical protein
MKDALSIHRLLSERRTLHGIVRLNEAAVSSSRR